jgi:hypothetical protein
VQTWQAKVPNAEFPISALENFNVKEALDRIGQIVTNFATPSKILL